MSVARDMNMPRESDNIKRERGTQPKIRDSKRKRISQPDNVERPSYNTRLKAKCRKLTHEVENSNLHQQVQSKLSLIQDAERQGNQVSKIVRRLATMPVEIIEMVLEIALYHPRPIDTRVLDILRLYLFRALNDEHLLEIGEKVFYNLNQFAIEYRESKDAGDIHRITHPELRKLWAVEHLPRGQLPEIVRPHIRHLVVKIPLNQERDTKVYERASSFPFLACLEKLHAWGYTGLTSVEVAVYDEMSDCSHYTDPPKWTWQSRLKDIGVKGYQTDGSNWENFTLI